MSIDKKVFGTLPGGKTAELYILKNKNGMTAEITDFGCRIIRLLTKDKNGNLGDVILGHNDLESYYGDNYQGTFVGRYANRIGNASFVLNGTTYNLSRNDGENTLHGGPGGYHQVLWNVSKLSDGDEPSITFSYLSPDGEEGYPGNLDITVTYTLSVNDEIIMEYCGVSDKETPFNPTNHAFFNLSGDPQHTIYDTVLTLNASNYTVVTDDLIPTGEIASVIGGPLDFTCGKTLGKDMFSDDHLIHIKNGFDHNFCVDGTGFRKVGEAYEPDSGRFMEFFSDLPGVQLYTFNKAPELIGKDGKPMAVHTSFCLETQFYPDSVNHANFPFEFLKPGIPFNTKTVYRFSVK